MSKRITKPRFDTDRLNDIPIEDVLEALNAERIGTSKKFKCFNKDAHKSGDKSASMSVHPTENYCTCFGCNAGGNPIALVMYKYGGDFPAACEWLHDTFRIPYLDQSANLTPRPLSAAKKEIEYLTFDAKRLCNTVMLDEWIPYYQQLNDERKLKLIYTAIYRFSLSTDQRAKVTYHAGRGIDSDHRSLPSVGYLSNADLKRLGSYLTATFPKDDLIRFNLFSPMDNAYYPGTWKYWSKTGFCVAPSMDLYSDMCNGFMLRNTDSNLDKKKPKEIQVTRPDISFPLPFGLTRELLLSDPTIPIYANEGYIDGLSLGQEKLFIAATGVHGLKEKVFGLLKGREVRLAFDMDNAGIRAMRGYDTVTVKRNAETVKEKIVTKYFLKTDKDQHRKSEFIRRINSTTKLTLNENSHKGLIDTMPNAGVRPVLVSWETKIDRQKFVTDINDILKEHKKIYQTDLQGKSIQDAVEALKQYYAPSLAENNKLHTTT